MKQTVYILTALLAMVFAMPSVAQNNKEIKVLTQEELEAEATVEAHRHELVNRVDSFADNAFVERYIYPKYKKNAMVLTGLAENYYKQTVRQENKDEIHRALKFSDLALAVNNKYVPAYILKGRIYNYIAETEEEEIQARTWFDKAIAANPKDPEGYLAYAECYTKKKEDAPKAVAKMSEILKYVPDYDVNHYAGRLYFDWANADSVNRYFYNANPENLTEADFYHFYVCLSVRGQIDTVYKFLPISEERFPRSATLHRWSEAFYRNQKEWDNAIAASDILINKCDSAELVCGDFINYGLAYAGLKQYDNAIAMYKRAVEYELKRENFYSDDKFNKAKDDEEAHKALAMQYIVTAYNDKGYPEEAIRVQKEYIAYRKEKGILSVNDLDNLAKLYAGQTEILMGEEKRNALKNAYDVYGELIEFSPENAAYGYYNRLKLAVTEPLFTDWKTVIGVPDAEEILRLLPVSQEHTKGETAQLTYALKFLVEYYLQNDKYIELGKYWKMLGEVAPEDSRYIQLRDNKYYRKMMRV